MFAWLEDIVNDERWYLVKEMHEAGQEHPNYNTMLSEVRLAEKVLEYIQGAMQEAGWGA